MAAFSWISLACPGGLSPEIVHPILVGIEQTIV